MHLAWIVGACWTLFDSGLQVGSGFATFPSARSEQLSEPPIKRQHHIYRVVKI